MKILLTGATGLIGRYLTSSLVQDGYKVQVLTRSPQRAAALLPPTVGLTRWDARTLGDWVAALKDTDAIIHLAGESIAGQTPWQVLTRRWSPSVKASILSSRVRTGKLLLAALQQVGARPRFFLQASAVGYYGPRFEPVDESAAPGTDFLAQVCRRWEAATAEVEALGIRRVVLRTGLVLDAQEGILPLMLLPVRLGVGGRLGSGKQPLPWIHLADEVAAIRFLLAAEDASGPYNLTAPEPVCQERFVQAAGRILRRPVWLPAPAWALRLALGEKATLVLEGQHALPIRLQQAGFTFRYPTLDEALQALLTG